MIRKLYRELTIPILLGVRLIKYGGIWGYKKQLQSKIKPNIAEIEVYDAFFRRKGSWIGYSAELEDIPCFPHGIYGVFISGGAKLGKNVVIFQQVTIGSSALSDSKKSGSPIIGDNVYIGAGAKIVGSIIIGNNCRIGANAVVYQDMQPHSVAVQVPTRIIQKENLDNRFYSQRNGQWVYFKDNVWVSDES